MRYIVIPFLLGMLVEYYIVLENPSKHDDEEYTIKLLDQDYVEIYSYSTQRTYRVKTSNIVQTLEYDNM